MTDVANAEAEDFKPRFAEKGVSFATELEPMLVKGDADRLGQIVTNLLANALRYTEPGGAARLRV